MEPIKKAKHVDVQRRDHTVPDWIGACGVHVHDHVRKNTRSEDLFDLMADMMVLKSRLPHGIISRLQLLVAPPDAPRLMRGWLLLSSTTALVETSLSADVSVCLVRRLCNPDTILYSLSA
jgi:hypothetical protein